MPGRTNGAVNKRTEADGKPCSKRSMDLIDIVAVSKVPSMMFEFQRRKVTLKVTLTLSGSIKHGSASIATISSEWKASDGEVKKNESKTLMRICTRRHEQHRQMQERLGIKSSEASEAFSTSSSNVEPILTILPARIRVATAQPFEYDC